MNGAEDGQGPSHSTQQERDELDPETYRGTMRRAIRNGASSPRTIINRGGAAFQKIKALEEEAKREVLQQQAEQQALKQQMLQQQRDLVEKKINLEKIQSIRRAELLKLTHDDIAATLNNTLETNLDLNEDIFAETRGQLRREQQEREEHVELIHLDTSINQEQRDQIEALISGNNEGSDNGTGDNEEAANGRNTDAASRM